MKWKRSLTIACVLALSASVGELPGELFTLSSGGQLVGKLVNDKEIPRKSYLIETASGIRVELEPREVTKVAKGRAILEEYARIAPRYPDTADAQWELSDWCRKNHLTPQRKVHLKRVVELDPERVIAWRALGYSRVNGKWMTQDEIMRNRGYVRYGGRWKLPQEVELIEQRKKQELAEREWFKKIKRWRNWLRKPNRSHQGWEQLREIDDPYALRAVNQFLEDETDQRVRLLYVGALARINTPPANRALVVRSLVDTNEETRISSLELLQKKKDPEIITMFVRALRSKNNIMINRAAMGLLAMDATEAVDPLIDALVTKHKFKVTMGNPNGGISMSFARPSSSGAQGAIGPNSGGFGGLSGMSMGSKTKIITRHIPNEQVLEALIHLTGQNFVYNITGWRQWFTAQQTPSSTGGTRRD